MFFVVIFSVLIFAHPSFSTPVNSLRDSPNRIIGGSVAADGSHPHMVGLSTGVLIKTFVCGASLIATRTILTAAHCVDAVFNQGTLSSRLQATLGSNIWHKGGQTYSITGNVTHQEYSPVLVKNDLALLYTSSAVVYSERVKPIVLSYAYVGEGIVCRTAGWGRIWYPYGPISDYLLELNVNTISEERCITETTLASENRTHGPTVDTRIELCVYRSPQHGLCEGDSGGALIRLDRNAQIGIMSWGFPCARGAPDIFVRISAYESWIAMFTRY